MIADIGYDGFWWGKSQKDDIEAHSFHDFWIHGEKVLVYSLFSLLLRHNQGILPTTTLAFIMMLMIGYDADWSFCIKR